MLEIVTLKETGKKVAIRPQDFNPNYHDRDLTPRPPEAKESLNLEDAHLSVLRREIVNLGGAPVKGPMANDRRALLAKIELLRGANVTEEAQVGDEEEENMDEETYLLGEYQKLYGKKPVGKWAKDKGWLTKKINEKK